jgi:ribosomal protein S18 acetylase RimI-like enzyme
MAPFEIRPAQSDDALAFARLVHEMDEHEKTSIAESVEATARFIAKTGIGPGETIEALLAVQDGAAIGFASFGKLYPTDEGRLGAVMKNLFITEAARGLGIGRALMKALAELCVERGYQRLHWTAERDNAAALELYRSLGAEVQEEKLYYRFKSAAMTRLSGAG